MINTLVYRHIPASDLKIGDLVVAESVRSALPVVVTVTRIVVDVDGIKVYGKPDGVDRNLTVTPDDGGHIRQAPDADMVASLESLIEKALDQVDGGGWTVDMVSAT